MAAQIAAKLAADDTNPDNVRTWRQRANAAHAFNMELIRAMGERPLFVVRVLWIRKTIPWKWLLRPMSWAFDQAATIAAPVDEIEVAK
jgi:hypothetical protein